MGEQDSSTVAAVAVLAGTGGAVVGYAIAAMRYRWRRLVNRQRRALRHGRDTVRLLATMGGAVVAVLGVAVGGLVALARAAGS
jgi:membrane protein YqaA with SNARE-associated domain